eukprot:scaffold3541_cov117-Isochrysis_galbana.AAC.13
MTGQRAGTFEEEHAVRRAPGRSAQSSLFFRAGALGDYSPFLLVLVVRRGAISMCAMRVCIICPRAPANDGAKTPPSDGAIHSPPWARA